MLKMLTMINSPLVPFSPISFPTFPYAFTVFPSPFFQCGVELVDSDSSPQNITMKCGASSLMLEYSQHTKDCLTTLLQTGEIYKILKKQSSVNKPSDKPVNSMYYAR